MLKSSIESELDQSDKAILRMLQKRGRISNVELAEQVFLSPPAVHARVKRLEAAGYIESYVALLDKAKLFDGNLCFIEISLELHQYNKVQEVLTSIVAMHEVLECHHVTGSGDYLLKVFVSGTQALEKLITKKLTPLPGMAKIHTSLVLKEIKTTTELPIE